MQTPQSKSHEKTLADTQAQLDTTSQRLETSDELRRQKQIKIEELSTQVVGDPHMCEGIQVGACGACAIRG